MLNYAEIRVSSFWVLSAARPSVYLRNVPQCLKAGDIIEVIIEDADAHVLLGVIAVPLSKEAAHLPGIKNSPSSHVSEYTLVQLSVLFYSYQAEPIIISVICRS